MMELDVPTAIRAQLLTLPDDERSATLSRLQLLALAARRTRVFQPIDSAEAVFAAIDGSEIRFHSALPVSICLLSRLGFGVRTPFALP